MAATTNRERTPERAFEYPSLRDDPDESGRTSGSASGTVREGVHVQTVAVTFDYPVVFTRDVFSWENLSFARAITRREPHRRHRLFVVIDRAVADANPLLFEDLARYVDFHNERLALVAPPMVLDGGEHAKNDPALVPHLHATFDAHGLDRQAFVVVIGGGSLQDVVGFAAATAHRGLRVVRVPTTVLAQADGGVGVKNGVNAFGKKNYLGTFAPPWAVIDDFELLRSLPRRDAIAGMAEAVKVALVRDTAFFLWIQLHGRSLAALEPHAVSELVRRCACLHLEHIATSGDPFELGSARPLDFGHWAAHKLEILTEHELRHGEAVAIGIALDAVYSTACGMLECHDLERILETMESLGLPLFHPVLDAEENGRRRILAGLGEFREHLGGELTITLLEGIGRGLEVHEIDDQLVLRAIDWLRHRAPRSAPSARARP